MIEKQWKYTLHVYVQSNKVFNVKKIVFSLLERTDRKFVNVTEDYNNYVLFPPELTLFDRHSHAWLMQAQWLDVRSHDPVHSDAMMQALLVAEIVKNTWIKFIYWFLQNRNDTQTHFDNDTIIVYRNKKKNAEWFK